MQKKTTSQLSGLNEQICGVKQLLKKIIKNRNGSVEAISHLLSHPNRRVLCQVLQK